MPMKRPLSALVSAVGTVGVVGAVLVGCGSANATTSGPRASGPLATYQANNARTGYSTDTKITAANVGSLKQRWSRRGTAAISTQAIVNKGVVYWGDWKG